MKIRFGQDLHDYRKNPACHPVNPVHLSKKLESAPREDDSGSGRRGVAGPASARRPESKRIQKFTDQIASGAGRSVPNVENSHDFVVIQPRK